MSELICPDCNCKIENGMQQHSPDTCIQNLRAKLEAAELTSSVLRAKLYESEEDRDNLRAQAKEWEEKYKQSCVKRADDIEKMFDIQAQVAVMRGALEDAITAVKYANKHVQSDSVNEIINKCDKVLSTPPEAGERVRGLVVALDRIACETTEHEGENVPTISAIQASDALAKFKEGE